VLDRELGQLSGGEVTRLGITRLLLQAPDVMLLDEPTNNLDRPARQQFYDVVDSYQGALLVVSHDRDLLERMDRMGELREGNLRWYGGGYSSYLARVTAEQESAQQAMVAAKADVRRQQSDRQEAERCSSPIPRRSSSCSTSRRTTSTSRRTRRWSRPSSRTEAPSWSSATTPASSPISASPGWSISTC